MAKSPTIKGNKSRGWFSQADRRFFKTMRLEEICSEKISEKIFIIFGEKVPISRQVLRILMLSLRIRNPHPKKPPKPA